MREPVIVDPRLIENITAEQLCARTEILQTRPSPDQTRTVHITGGQTSQMHVESKHHLYTRLHFDLS